MINLDSITNENNKEHNKKWEDKYEYLIKSRENVGIKHLNDSNAFKCSNATDDVYENIDDFNPNRKRKLLTIFDEMIAGIISNKKFQAIIK